MTALEMFRVRLFDPRYQSILELLVETLQDSAANSKTPVTVSAYRNREAESDWSILIARSAEEILPPESTRVVYLLDALKEIGVVQYTVWLPANSIDATTSCALGAGSQSR